MADIPTHHFIYGTCQDYLTGDSIIDTDDERLRQKLARFLVEEKGYDKADLQPRLKIETLFAKQFVVSTIDFVVRYADKQCMVLRYGPGSMVTRERPAIAAARVLNSDYQIPLVIVTNSVDAEIIDTATGKVISTGLDAIPSKEEIGDLLTIYQHQSPIEESKREKELRILNAFDIEVCCAGGPCALPNAPEG